MSKPYKFLVVFAAFSCLLNLFIGQYVYAASSGFIAIMLLLIGIEEQL